mmetsp:Transcript_42343/g.88935  ORF Transcript_42343/g.88935 Transcript_42343/m.88935 type:complete len:237 (+) Transcript_42343:142-852(+)
MANSVGRKSLFPNLMARFKWGVSRTWTWPSPTSLLTRLSKRLFLRTLASSPRRWTRRMRGIGTMTTIVDPKRRMPPRSVRSNVILVAPETTLTALNKRSNVNAKGRAINPGTGPIGVSILASLGVETIISLVTVRPRETLGVIPRAVAAAITVLTHEMNPTAVVLEGMQIVFVTARIMMIGLMMTISLMPAPVDVLLRRRPGSLKSENNYLSMMYTSDRKGFRSARFNIYRSYYDD